MQSFSDKLWREHIGWSNSHNDAPEKIYVKIRNILSPPILWHRMVLFFCVTWPCVSIGPFDLHRIIVYKLQIFYRSHRNVRKYDGSEFLTCVGGVRIFSIIESMHFLTIPRFSAHSGNVAVVWSVAMESFQPSRMHELKKASSFPTKFPFSMESFILRNLAAQRAGTKLWALMLIAIP